MPNLIGQTVSHYKILEHLGGGGMGIVYKAQDLKLERPVALKFLPPDLTRDPEAKERFIHEAKAASALQHSNICTVHDIDQTDDGQMFIVMDLYEGETLKKKIERGPLPIDEAVNIASLVAQGLSRSHEAGIIHRDVKPANIMVTDRGEVKIVDFGLAKLSGRTVLTRTGTTVGTTAYMSPEQAQGAPIDARTDIWSLGVVLYEMLTGQRPFRSEHEQGLIYSIINTDPEPMSTYPGGISSELSRIVSRALQKKPDSRYLSAAEMLRELLAYQQSLHAPGKGVTRLAGHVRHIWQPRIAVPLAGIVLALCVLAIFMVYRQSKLRMAREELLPKIEQLIDGGRENYVEAYKLAVQAEKYLPDDKKLAGFLSTIAVTISIESEPAGATVYMKEYKSTAGGWEYLGVSPMENIRMPIGFFRFKMEKEGYETVNAVVSTYEMNFRTAKFYVPKNTTRVLDKKGEIPPGMVRARGDTVKGVGALGDFYIDEYEVTNKQYKDFITRGGYRKNEYWKQRFIKNGKEVSWEEAVKEFVDQTGRPGPSTWQAGDYPEGQDEYPVSGVSWHEAEAYAEFAGKSLPTLYHWGIASGGGFSPSLLSRGLYTLMAPMSNFNGKGPVPVGSSQGMTSFGAYDMAGNVREWCWNESPKGRIIRGGAWNDATYMFSNRSQASPFDRSPKNGFRCAVYIDSGKIPQQAFASVTVEEAPDLYRMKPVPDAVFQAYREQFAYDKTELNPRVEWKNDSARDWVTEKVSFNAAYGNERVIAYLFVPKNFPPPYQTVIYFPGAGALYQTSSVNMETYWEFDARLSLLVKNGRAVLFPVYDGTFERRDDALAFADENSHLNTEFLIRLVKDLKRCIDYLESRPDINSRKIAYFGFSWGGYMGGVIPAVEERLKASVLAVGGLTAAGRPEANEINYVTRVKVPTLMLNGRFDMTSPYETTAKPLFDLLGTPKKDKRQILYDTDHFIPKNEFTKEALDWLDRYLGPVK